MGVADQCEMYGVIYSANGADSGLVPVDERNYQPGDEIFVRTNISSLSLTGYSFMGWNTDSNGASILYNGGNTPAMGRADITLFAEWLEGKEDAGIRVDPTSGLVTSEAGDTATLTVALSSEPTAEVRINLSSSDTGEGTVRPNSLTFTTGNWSGVQAETVTGVDDAIGDGSQTYTIVTAAAVSGDKTTPD